MTSIECYKSFQLKINKNDTNSDIDINRGEFVLLYKEQKDRWLKEQINRKESLSDSEDIEEIFVKHKELEKVNSIEKDYTVFKLPENYFSYVSSYSICNQKDCGGILVRNFKFKPKNENMLLENTNTQPDFEFEETVVDLSENKIFVYKKDFTIDKVFLNYYRKIGEIDIEGYRKLDGSFSKNVNPDISDVYVEEIINRCAKEVIRRYENPEGFQFAQERVITEE
jgi:phage pi2 protein 07